jgi:hypothetical protein
MNKSFRTVVALACAVFLLLLGSCSKSTPSAACVASVTSPATINAPVTFVSCTQGASSYTWSFGDGSSASGDSVIHTFSMSGTFHASLTVVVGGTTSVKNFNVTILPTGWTFRGGVFSVDSAVFSLAAGTLTASGSSASGPANLTIRFFPVPTFSYPYSVINASNGSGSRYQLYAVLSRDSAGVQTLYGSTGTDSLSAQVGVSAGKISVALPSIQMYNLSNPSDSSELFATFTQTR